MILVLSISNSGTFFVYEFLSDHGIEVVQQHFTKDKSYNNWKGKIVIPYRDCEKVIESNVRNKNKSILDEYMLLWDFKGKAWYFYINDPDRRGALLGLHDYCGCTDIELTNRWVDSWPVVNSTNY